MVEAAAVGWKEPDVCWSTPDLKRTSESSVSGPLVFVLDQTKQAAETVDSRAPERCFLSSRTKKESEVREVGSGTAGCADGYTG